MERALLLFHPSSFPVSRSYTFVVLAALAVPAAHAVLAAPIANPIR